MAAYARLLDPKRTSSRPSISMTGFSSTGSRARTGSSALHFRDDRERGLALVVVQDPDRTTSPGLALRTTIGPQSAPRDARRKPGEWCRYRDDVRDIVLRTKRVDILWRPRVRGTYAFGCVGATVGNLVPNKSHA